MIRFLPVLLLMACSVQAGEPQPLSEFRSVRYEGSNERAAPSFSQPSVWGKGPRHPSPLTRKGLR